MGFVGQASGAWAMTPWEAKQAHKKAKAVANEYFCLIFCLKYVN